MSELLQGYVDRQAERFPDRIALIHGAAQMSYGDIGTASNRLARALAAVGCRRGDRVCLLMPKSPEAIIALLGTLKADCIYVPLDIASPRARTARVIDVVEPRVVLASGDVTVVLDRLEGHRASLPIGWLGSDGATAEEVDPIFNFGDVATYPSHPLSYANDVDDPAHILFTSGSTGQPKGVVVTHRSVRHFVEWAVEYFGLTSEDRTSGHSPLHFDLSTFDIYGTFAAGASLHMVPPELNLIAPRLAEFIRDHALTQWFSVPSILSYLASFDVIQPGDFPAMKRLLWCGEVFPTPQLMHWMSKLPHVSFTNLYGPTEATIASSYFSLSASPASPTEAVPIGQACPGERLHVLDESMVAVPAGTVGDLYISGVGLSPGYWRDPQRTAASFVADPETPGGRLYRTGDLASIGDEGLIYLHGRSDHQIKSRGYRIELGEIEVALNTLDRVGEVAVVAVTASGFEGSSICCAYTLPSGVKLSPADIRRELRQLLPSYMVPTRWLHLERLPRNVNGKIDRRLLQDRFATPA